MSPAARPPLFYFTHVCITFHMKVLLLIIIGALLWSNDEARQFTADRLDDASEIVRPQRDRNEFKITF